MPSGKFYVDMGSDDCERTSAGDPDSYTCGTFFVQCGDYEGDDVATIWCFSNVTIDQGQNIDNMYFRFTSGETISGDEVKLRITAMDEDAPWMPQDGVTHYVNDITKTTAYVDWTVPALTDTVKYLTPDISSVIQEVINRPGWQSGNDMVLFLDNNGSDTNKQIRIASWDGYNFMATDEAPTLSGTWSTQPIPVTYAALNLSREVMLTPDHKIIMTQ